MTRILGRWPLLSTLAAGVALASAGARADDAALPQYVAEPCCQLCPQAANPANYPNGFMSNFRQLVQGQDDWLFRSELDLRRNFMPDAVSLAKLKQLNDALAARGTQLVMVFQPTRGLVHPGHLSDAERRSYDWQAARDSYQRTTARFRELGIVVPDLSPLFDEPNDDAEPYFFKGDHHWTPFGAERTAERVAAEIAQLPAVQGLPQTRFVTRPEGLLAKRGTLQRAAQQICGFGSPDQYVQRFVTEPAEAASGDALFADESNPQIVLAGTSNSSEALNFNGFLEQALEREILNVSMIGGGMDSALIQYLDSDSFRDNPPKVLIWEFGAYHNLGQQNFYREALPLANGGCGAPALSRKDLALKPGTNPVLVNTDARKLVGKRYMLDVKYADPSVDTLRATVWYMTGKKESIKLERPSNMEGNGHFSLALRDDAEYRDQEVLGVDLELPEGVEPGTKVSAQLCQRPGPATTQVAGN